MPSEKSSAIVTASEPLVHGERVIQCVGATRPIIGRMNSDKCRTHRPMQGTPAIPRRDDVLHDFQFGCTGGSPPADGDAWGAAAQEEKRSPTRTTARNPNVRSFTVTIPAVPRGRRLKAARRESCRIIRHLGSENQIDAAFIYRLIFLRKHRLDAGCFKSFSASTVPSNFN